VLNVAEGAGTLSAPDKRRFYQTARGSATESAALLDACQRVNLITDADHRLGKEMLLRLVSMLVKLTRSFETPLLPDKT
jgi:four helix bundle protein